MLYHRPAAGRIGRAVSPLPAVPDSHDLARAGVKRPTATAHRAVATARQWILLRLRATRRNEVTN